MTMLELLISKSSATTGTTKEYFMSLTGSSTFIATARIQLTPSPKIKLAKLKVSLAAPEIVRVDDDN